MNFTDRYMICSVRGRIWTRAMLRKLIMERYVLSPRHREAIDGVLDDISFMQGHAGMIPTRVAEAVADEAWLRKKGD